MPRSFVFIRFWFNRPRAIHRFIDDPIRTFINVKCGAETISQICLTQTNKKEKKKRFDNNDVLNAELWTHSRQSKRTTTTKTTFKIYIKAMQEQERRKWHSEWPKHTNEQQQQKKKENLIDFDANTYELEREAGKEYERQTKSNRNGINSIYLCECFASNRSLFFLRFLFSLFLISNTFDASELRYISTTTRECGVSFQFRSSFVFQ